MTDTSQAESVGAFRDLSSVPYRVKPGESELASYAPALPAPADEAVADNPHRPDVQQGIVSPYADRQDAGSVEHTRQSRLQRWQRQP